MSTEPTTDQTIDAVAGFRHAVRLASIDPKRNRFRFFILCWQPTLWDRPALACTWGRVGRPGCARVVPVPDGVASPEAIRRLLRRQLPHGAGA